MTPDSGRVIVGAADHSSVTRDCTKIHAHHSDFPEVRGEGCSAEEAVARLAESLSRALDSAPSVWRRGILERAIEEVKALAARSRPGASGITAAERRDGGP